MSLRSCAGQRRADTPLIARGSGKRNGRRRGGHRRDRGSEPSRCDRADRQRATARDGGTGRAARRGERARAPARSCAFPVDPSSGAFCTIGGMAATNAAGAHTLRYGSTRAWVTALDCVFADGSRALIQRGAPLPELARHRALSGHRASGDPRVARARACAPGRAEGFVRIRARRLRAKRRAARSAGRKRGNARAVRGDRALAHGAARARRAASWRSSRRWSRPWTAPRAHGWAARARASCSIAPSSTWRGAGRRSSRSTARARRCSSSRSRRATRSPRPPWRR